MRRTRHCNKEKSRLPSLLYVSYSGPPYLILQQAFETQQPSFIDEVLEKLSSDDLLKAVLPNNLSVVLCEYLLKFIKYNPAHKSKLLVFSRLLIKIDKTDPQISENINKYVQKLDNIWSLSV